MILGGNFGYKYSSLISSGKFIMISLINRTITKSIVLTSLFIIFIIFVECKDPSQGKLQHQLEDCLDDYIEENSNILGAIAEIDIIGNNSLKAAKGYFDSAKTRPISSSDKFTIGSITKMFIATLVFQLIEEETIRYDDRIIHHLPDEWINILKDIKYGNKITIGQALSHRTGVYDYITSLTFFNKLLESYKWSHLELMQLVRDEGKPKFKPGEKYSYSNTNYFLLGAVIEHVTGKSLQFVLKDNIFSKLGLINTELLEGVIGSNYKDITHGYFSENGIKYDFQYLDSGWAWAAGGIFSTSNELNKFLSSLVSGKMYKKAGTFKQMLELLPGSEYYAHGIMSWNIPAIGRYYGHSGYEGASSVAVYYYPQKQICITVYISFYGSSNRIRASLLINEILRDVSLD